MIGGGNGRVAADVGEQFNFGTRTVRRVSERVGVEVMGHTAVLSSIVYAFFVCEGGTGSGSWFVHNK